MSAEGLPAIMDFMTWFFLEERPPAEPDCGEDAGYRGCGGALNMLCARNLAGDVAVWWPFEACMMANQSAIPTNAPACARTAKIDAADLAACVDGPRGAALLAASAAATAAAGVVGTPSLFIDGKLVAGSLDYKRLVCDAYRGPRPAACASSP